MGRGKRYSKGMMATNPEGERSGQFLHWCYTPVPQSSPKRECADAERETPRAGVELRAFCAESRFEQQRIWLLSTRRRRPRCWLSSNRGGVTRFSRAHPGRARTWRARVRWTLLHSTRRYVMSGSVDGFVCDVCAVYVCVTPPTRAYRSVGAWIRSSRLKAVAEATERVHQRPVLALSPSVGELLPLCYYDYMMLLVPRSKRAILYSSSCTLRHACQASFVRSLSVFRWYMCGRQTPIDAPSASEVRRFIPRFVCSRAEQQGYQHSIQIRFTEDSVFSPLPCARRE